MALPVITTPPPMFHAGTADESALLPGAGHLLPGAMGLPHDMPQDMLHGFPLLVRTFSEGC